MHKAIKLDDNHFFGHNQAVFLTRLCDDHVPGLNIESKTFDSGDPLSLNNEPELIAIVEVRFNRVAGSQRVDPVIGNLAPGWKTKFFRVGLCHSGTPSRQ